MIVMGTARCERCRELHVGFNDGEGATGCDVSRADGATARRADAAFEAYAFLNSTVSHQLLRSVAQRVGTRAVSRTGCRGARVPFGRAETQSPRASGRTIPRCTKSIASLNPCRGADVVQPRPGDPRGGLTGARDRESRPRYASRTHCQRRQSTKRDGTNVVGFHHPGRRPPSHVPCAQRSRGLTRTS
jgi:hypothetical protein